MPADEETPPRRRASLGSKLLLALAAFVLPIVVLELGARLALDPPPPHAFPGLSPGQIADDELLWRNAPGYALRNKHGPINSLGLRGPEVRVEKTPGVTRILSLGESSTFGDSVAWNRTYSAQLQAVLRQRGQRVEVWNGGVRAWSTVQSLRFLEREIDHLDPDIVLFYHEVNDFLPTVLRRARFRSAGLTDRQTMELSSGRSWILKLIRSSRLLTWLSLAQARSRADSLLKRVGEKTETDVMLIMLLPYHRLRPQADGDSHLPWMENPSPLVRVPDPERERALRQLIALTRARGVQLVFFHPAYLISLPHRCLLTRIADEEGIPIVELEGLLAEDMRRSGRPRSDYFVPDDNFHPNPRGHRLFARGAADVLLGEGLLDGAGG